MYLFELGNIKFPIAPSKLQIKISNKNKTLMLIDGREINMLKAPGLTELNFDVMLPINKYPFALYTEGFQMPDYYLKFLEDMKKSKKYYKFKVTRTSAKGDILFGNDMNVSLEDYTITEDANEGGDIVVGIKLKEFIEYGTGLLTKIEKVEGNVVKVSPTKEERPSKEPNKTHMVVEGDTLWSICKKELNDGSKYMDIAKLNGISNPTELYVGQVLKLG